MALLESSNHLSPLIFFACWPYQFILSARIANAVVLGEPDFDVVDLKLPGQANIVDNQSTFSGIKSPLCKGTWRDQRPTPTLKEY